MSQTPGVIQWVGYDRAVYEEEEGKVSQEVQQVKGLDTTELSWDNLFELWTDPSSSQLHQQLLGAEKALLGQ